MSIAKTNHIFWLNADNNPDPKYLSKFLSILEDNDLLVWDIVYCPLDSAQAQYIGMDDAAEGISMFLFQCDGSRNSCRCVLQEVTEKFDLKDYGPDFFFVKLLDTDNADNFLDANSKLGISI